MSCKLQDISRLTGQVRKVLYDHYTADKLVEKFFIIIVETIYP
ncbi:MAG: hypothetical protein AB8U16_01560 [Rickettsiales endosymbiont of Dermacentor nuttalli]